MPEFQHLNLVQVVERKQFIPHGGGPPKGDQANYNLGHRKEHFDNLTKQLADLKENWNQQLVTRTEQGLPEIDKEIIPLYLQIDEAKDLESLKSFGIEIISEEKGGFIVGANADDFKLFTDRLEQFLNQSNKKFQDSAATLLEVFTEPTARLKKILSSGLLSKWEEIEAVDEIVIYLAISAYLKVPDYPTKGTEQSSQSYENAIQRWKQRNAQWEIAKENLVRERQTAFEKYIAPYNPEFVGKVSQYSEFDDGFGCKIRISGKGLKDIAIGFPYVFNIAEHDSLQSFQGSTELQSLLEIEISAPPETAPRVCVIDSGIQEGHRLLVSAVENALSISYVPNDADTFDKVPMGGHGTRVAGVILFPHGIPVDRSSIPAPFWLQNARILDQNNLLHHDLDEVELMTSIVRRFNSTKLFNLSVSNLNTEEYTHMPIWSASIDKLIWENDILFFISAGNISGVRISEFISSGNSYPDYLRELECKITNPGYSCFALTVGSVCHVSFDNETHKSIANENYPSSFSRCGLGLWGMVKPDVVEYGGDYVIDKETNTNITVHETTSPNLIRSTRDDGPATGRDQVGTSFTAPKVTHIAAALQNLFPGESSLVYRALIVQSARIPLQAQRLTNFIEHYGYGIPDFSRATTNSPKRVTLYSSGSVNPKNSDIYLVKIPTEVNRPGYDFDILIEITLAYKAEPRITRRKTNSYVSAWVDWETSRKGESQRAFSERILKKDNDEPENDAPAGGVRTEAFHWTIQSKLDDGEIKGVKRQDSSIQKDWCVEKSNQLPDEFLIAVKGHKGWEKDLDKQVPYSIVVSFEILTPDIEVDIYSEIRIENEIQIRNNQRIETGI